MKAIDFGIVAAVLGCLFVGYSGHRVIAILLLLLTLILASWRFWDHRRERELMRGGSSGDLNPERDGWADLRSDEDP